MTGTPTAPPVLIRYDTTGYPQLPATAPVQRVLRPTGSGDGSGRRRRRRWGARSVAGAVAVLLVAAVAVRCSGIGPTDSPESLVRSVFAALTAHDGKRFADLGWCDSSPLCTAGGLTTGYQAPEHVEIISSGRGKDRRGITVRYTVGGAPAQETVEVTRYSTGMLGHRWAISTPPGAHLDLRTAASDKIHVGGVTVAANPVDVAGGAIIPRPFAPPGAYTVGIDTDELFDTTAVTVTVAAGVDPPPTVVTPKLRQDVQPKLEQQIRDRISYCAGQHAFQPYTAEWRTTHETCPFAHYPRSPFTKPPTWTVEQQPKITLRVDDHAGVTVRTTSPGVAVVRYQWSVSIVEPREWTDASETVEFTVDGKVTVKDGAPYWVG